MRGPRLKRDLAEMVDRLASQLRVLDHLIVLAFGPPVRAEFLAEIATKLRILIVRAKHNVPLLLEVADRLSIPITVNLDGPPFPIRLGGQTFMPGDDVSLDLFLDFDALTIWTSAGPVKFTKRQLIRAWSEQLGGAHEDWAVDEGLLNALNTGIRIAGGDPTVMELRNTARLVLRKGNELIGAANAILAGANQTNAS